MSRTIKIIDLLNKIANGEEVPKRIKVSCYTFEWQEEGRYYKDINATRVHSLVQDWLNNANKLNSEAKILDNEPEEIEEKNLYYVVCESDFNNMKIVTLLNEFFRENNRAIDELTRAVNQIRKEKE